MSTTGRAALFFGPGQPMEITELGVPSPEPGAVVVRVTRANICGSDLHIWRGDGYLGGMARPDGRIIGHEMTGVVHALGVGVTTDWAGTALAEGDRVAYQYFAPRGRCRSCTRGMTEACASSLKVLQGKPDVFPYFRGAFADHFYVTPEVAIFKVPDDVTDSMVAGVNCALAQVVMGLEIGTFYPGTSLELDPGFLVMANVRIEAVAAYDARSLQLALDFLHRHIGDLPLDAVVADYPLERRVRRPGRRRGHAGVPGDDVTAGWQYGDLWDLAAEVRGDQPALVHGDDCRSWAAFRARSAAVAAGLVSGGAAQGDRVALYLYDGPEYLEGVYACFQAGLTPINTNYRYRSGELAHLWDDADAVAVVFHGTFADTVAPLRDSVSTVRRWLWVDDGSGPCPSWAEPYERVAGLGWDGPFVAPWRRSGDDIVMTYTGGTTGTPKGVMWRHHDLHRAFSTSDDGDRADLDAVGRRLAGAERGPIGLPGSPLMHATGLMFAVSTLTQGGTVVTMPNRSFDAVALLDAVERERVEALAIVGDAFARPSLEALDGDARTRDLSFLAMLVSAGVMWSEETKAGLARHLPQTVLMDLLGSTEAHGLGSAVTAPGADATTARFRLGHHAMVIDDHDRPVGPGGTGMLAVGGPLHGRERPRRRHGRGRGGGGRARRGRVGHPRRAHSAREGTLGRLQGAALGRPRRRHRSISERQGRLRRCPSSCPRPRRVHGDVTNVPVPTGVISA